MPSSLHVRFLVLTASEDLLSIVPATTLPLLLLATWLRILPLELRVNILPRDSVSALAGDNKFLKNAPLSSSSRFIQQERLLSVKMADVKELQSVEVLQEKSMSSGDPEANARIKTTANGIPLVPQPSDDPEDPLVRLLSSEKNY